MKITWINVLICLFKMLISILCTLNLSMRFLWCMPFLSIKYKEPGWSQDLLNYCKLSWKKREREKHTTFCLSANVTISHWWWSSFEGRALAEMLEALFCAIFFSWTEWGEIHIVTKWRHGRGSYKRTSQSDCLTLRAGDVLPPCAIFKSHLEAPPPPQTCLFI